MPSFPRRRKLKSEELEEYLIKNYKSVDNNEQTLERVDKLIATLEKLSAVGVRSETLDKLIDKVLEDY